MSRPKQIAELALALASRSQLLGGRSRGRTLVLAYHNIIADGRSPDGDQSLHLPISVFRAHLDVIQSTASVIAISDLFKTSIGSERPRVAITFDDAYRGAVTLGLAEIRARRLCATMFIAPAFVPDGRFWWDDSCRVGQNALSADIRDRALHEFRGRDAEVRAAALVDSRSLPPAPEQSVCASVADLEGAVAEGISYGSHTWSHPNLAALADEDLIGELAPPLAWLHERFPSSACPWLSYPYGLFSAAAKQQAARLGYAGAFRVDGGWLRQPPGDLFELPRLNVPAGLSANGLAARLARLLPS